MYEGISDLKRSCPAVSHNCSLTVLSSKYMVFDKKSIPIVAWYVLSKLSYMNLVISDVFPTVKRKETPTNITYNKILNPELKSHNPIWIIQIPLPFYCILWKAPRIQSVYKDLDHLLIFRLRLVWMFSLHLITFINPQNFAALTALLP